MRAIRRLISALLLSLMLWAGCLAASTPPPPTGPYYGVFRELPVTDITPQGWLEQFLDRQRDGLGLHYVVCGYPFDTCMWTGKIHPPKSDGTPSDKPANWDAYEQTAYLIDGLYRCGVLLQNAPLKKLGEDNIRYILDHPAEDGKLGPPDMNAMSVKIKTPTQWPFAVMSRAMMAYYSVTGDKRLLDALTRHYLALPADFGTPARDREVDSVEGMCWVYGQTGDPRLIEKAEQTYKNFTANPKSQWSLANLTAAQRMRGHGVSVSEATKQPALLYLYTGKKEYLDAVIGGFTSLHRDHEMVDGVTTSDSGLSGKEPDHEHETCVVSDYTWSLGYLLQASGDAQWADTIERCVFNAGLSVVDKDFKSLEYYASPNQVVATNRSMTPTVGVPYRELQAYRPDMSVQCCTGNVHRFLPNYVLRMWMSDTKGGLAATFYGPNTVQAAVGSDNVPITIEEKTDYPFDGTVSLTLHPARPVRFPLSVRIPGWAEGATVSVNGQPVDAQPTPATFHAIDRTFNPGDRVTLHFPMKVRMENAVADGVSLVRGPLVFVLKVKVDAKVGTKRIASTFEHDPAFPNWDLTAASPWNYALALKGPEDLDKVKVSVRPLKDFPWTPESSPVVLTVPARRVPAWQLTPQGTNPPLPKPPLSLAAETEEVQLIPDGATQLRIAVFPAAPTPAP